jgi:hypothetical protein
MEQMMRTTLRLSLIAFATEFADAQYQPPPPPAPLPPRSNTFMSEELVRDGHKFFGTMASGLAQVVETSVSRWGEPNGYVIGQEGGGAFIFGLRYGTECFIQRMPATIMCSRKAPRPVLRC